MKKPKTPSPRRRAATAPSATGEEFPAELAWLACAAPAATPPPRLKRTLLARIAAEEKAAARPVPQGWRFDSIHTRRGWLTMPFPGVRMKELSADRTSALVLVEMERGASFPDHEHEFTDEGVILSGEVTSGGRLLQAGDYYYAGPGSTHCDIVSPGGCTALVRLGASAWRDLRAQGVPVA